ncbi:MAG: biliverdin-producing heme oxygenase [Cyanobacteriota bacterium]|nr:biliverdin-producing heme oxygenase [Cyanobacteriota bacterium]
MSKDTETQTAHQGLALQLKLGTQKSHTMAENVGFIKCFLKGVVGKKSYSRYVGNFYFVYSALEEAFTQLQDHPVVGKLYYPELWRKPSLEEDLTYFCGSNWAATVHPSPACQLYVKRIQEIAQQDPVLLVAHAYTRYIGDLSGGQILKKIAKRAMGLPDGVGMAFYDFELIKHEGLFKKQYRAALDTLPVDPATVERIVAEANYAFELNMMMFKELEGNWLISMMRLGWNSLLSQWQRKAPRTEAAPSS